LVAGVVGGLWGAYKKNQTDKEVQRRQEIKQLLLERQRIIVGLEKRKKAYEACREAAMKMKMQKFVEKKMWSLVRHVVIGCLTHGVGNFAEEIYSAWDMLDLVEFADMISDYTDHLGVLQDHHDTMLATNQQLSNDCGVHFGGNTDTPELYHDSLSGKDFPNVTSVTVDLDPQFQIPDSTAQALKDQAKAATDILANKPATFL